MEDNAYTYHVLVKGYPTFSNQVFTYVHSSSLPFGTRVLVPFGNHNQPRQGIVLGTAQSNQKELHKKIVTVLSESEQITNKHLSFFSFISVYNLIPLYSIFLRAGLFAAKWNPKPYYLIQHQNLTKLHILPQETILTQYFNKHPSGFSSLSFKRSLKNHSSDNLLKKLEKMDILEKTYQYPDTNFSSLQKPEQSNQPPKILILNKLNPTNRLQFYSNFIQQYNAEDSVLIVVPNRKQKEQFEKFFSSQIPEASVVIGTRDSLLEPLQIYSLIIVEDSTNPEYSFPLPFSFPLEKSCLVRSQELNEDIIFGSYLPSVFTYSELKKKTVSHIKVASLGSSNSLEKPSIKLLDLRKEITNHGYALIPFSVQRRIQQVLDAHQKVLLFVNRKGYFNTCICTHCGHVIRCPLCGVALSYQPTTNKVVCRYCGYALSRPRKCPKCTEGTVILKSPGTNKIEEYATNHFRNASVLRIDQSVSSEGMIPSENYNIFVGTQKVFHSVHFDSISLVVFLEVDSMLNTPAFSAQEKVLHTISRIYEHLIHSEKKQIIIPTFSPKNTLFRSIMKGSLGNFYQEILSTREIFSYPPYNDWLEVSLKHKNPSILKDKTKKLKELLQNCKDIVIVSEKPLLGKSPHGLYQSSIIFRSGNFVQQYKDIAEKLDTFKKEERIQINTKNMES